MSTDTTDTNQQVASLPKLFDMVKEMAERGYKQSDIMLVVEQAYRKNEEEGK